ncbi:hypothetical protein ACFYYR_10960 [Streptomyces sp. NPDC001922]|uniref:hypothetical protein n=1 Tax=Streptomyces sp. NPDC001922 TaxID=3364624 RepID=UPI0036B95BA4
MEIELTRHPWASLQGVSGDARGLESAIRDLAGAKDRGTALEASGRVERVIFAQGLLCEASTAVAASLVHCLWRSAEHSEDLILGLLSDLSAAVVNEEDPDVYGHASRERCMQEIVLAYPGYVEILETGSNVNSRTACIDLILMCGIEFDYLRDRSIHYLESALRLEGLDGHSAVIGDSLTDLREAGAQPGRSC